jgi:hypothetical protein
MATVGPEPHPQADDLDLSSFDSIPLFMRSLPNDEGEENAALAALQSLAHEGTPDGR